MDICFSINDAYTEPLLVTLFSILKSSPKASVRFHVISSGLLESNRCRLETFIGKFEQASIDFKTVNAEMFQDMKLTLDHITIETYFRYVIADLFPELDKMLYLDADLIAIRDITDLWNIDLGGDSGYFAAGKPDWHYHKTGYCKSIGLLPDDIYINAGVLLLNLSAIRKEGMTARLFEAQKKYEGIIRWQDQCVINLVFRKRILPLAKKWNVGNRKVFSLFWAHILHFNGLKPWRKLEGWRRWRQWFYKPAEAVWLNRRKQALKIETEEQ